MPWFTTGKPVDLANLEKVRRPMTKLIRSSSTELTPLQKLLNTNGIRVDASILSTLQTKPSVSLQPIQSVDLGHTVQQKNRYFNTIFGTK